MATYPNLQTLRIQAKQEWLNIQACDRLLVNSYFSRETALRNYGVDAKVCYLGVDTKLFRNLGLKRERFIVGLGSFDPIKGVDLAVEAVSLLLDRGLDINAVSATGNTALHGAIGRGDAVVKLLADRGATLVRNNAGFSPLDLALGAGGRGGRGGVVRESTAALLRQLYPDAKPSDPPAPRPRNALSPTGAQ